MTRPIVNVNDAELVPATEHGDKFACRIAPISQQLGARRLGYNVTAVAPGKRAFPFHNHHMNEEMFFVVQGTGTLRYGQEEHSVRAGDVIACPPGGPEVAHQLINTGTEELRYLAVSTTIETDVFQYPDSGKFGFAAGRTPGARAREARFSGFYDERARRDYWDGE